MGLSCHPEVQQADTKQGAQEPTEAPSCFLESSSHSRIFLFENFSSLLIHAILHHQGSYPKELSGKYWRHKSQITFVRMPNALNDDLRTRPFPRRFSLFTFSVSNLPNPRIVTSLFVENCVNAPIGILNTQAFIENQIKDFREHGRIHFYRCLWNCHLRNVSPPSMSLYSHFCQQYVFLSLCHQVGPVICFLIVFPKNVFDIEGWRSSFSTMSTAFFEFGQFFLCASIKENTGH